MSDSHTDSPSHGSMPSVSYEAGFIVLSFFVSLAGCMTTLELLHRRTSKKGLYNWFLLIAASITMGAGGIWSMHFIGNRAVILAENDPVAQIVYSSGFTAVSILLPISVLILAFYLLGSTSKASPLYLILAGFLTGGAVCGMHYIGNAGIANYSCSYDTGNVVGAAIIAIAASLIALSVFFRLRERWTDSWWKRNLCAVVLATAVTGMHWTAAVGTNYESYGDDHKSSAASRVQTVIVCAVLSIGCCVLLLGVTVARGRMVRVHKQRAQQIVLASGYFDEAGRIMLTSDGAMPCQKITKRFIEKNFGDDELSKAHPTFLWVFHATRTWKAIIDLIPDMTFNLSTDSNAQRYAPGNAAASTVDISCEPSVNFSPVFKQLFCLAAKALAHALHEPLENLGVLFEEPLDTGNTVPSSRHSKTRPWTSPKLHDTEGNAGELSFGQGKYLFVNRTLNKATSEKFAAMGYRFGPIPQVFDLLGRRMDVAPEKMRTVLERMKASACEDRLYPAGVHLTCFMLRPSIYRPFDILVPDMAQNRLPYVPLPNFEHLNEREANILARYDEWMVGDILHSLVNESGRHALNLELQRRVHSTFLRLIALVGDPDRMTTASFSAKRIQVPCQSPPNSNHDSPKQTCTLFTIRIMTDIHTRAPKGMTYVPLSFFSAQQTIEGVDADRANASFVQSARSEFGSTLSQKQMFKREDATVRSVSSAPSSMKSPVREMFSEGLAQSLSRVFRLSAKPSNGGGMPGVGAGGVSNMTPMAKRKDSEEGKLVGSAAVQQVAESMSEEDENGTASTIGSSKSVVEMEEVRRPNTDPNHGGSRHADSERQRTQTVIRCASPTDSEIIVNSEGKIMVTETFSVMTEDEYERLQSLKAERKAVDGSSGGGGRKKHNYGRGGAAVFGGSTGGSGGNAGGLGVSGLNDRGWENVGQEVKRKAPPGGIEMRMGDGVGMGAGGWVGEIFGMFRL